VASPTYVAFLVAVAVDQIDEVREHLERPAAIELVASRVEQCPHDLTGVEVHPLGRVLAEAIDVGQPLRNDAWHPLRAPIVVDPETVTARARKLDEAVALARGELSGLIAEALGADIDKVRQLYAHAASRGEAVVSFLATEQGPLADGALVPRVRVHT
jgi:hypothetical protein